ncbi:hypothetical protein ACEQPO_22520 [Bacillus sp. SL00103]
MKITIIWVRCDRPYLTKALSSEYEITIIDQTGCVKGVILADATNEQGIM